MPDLKVLLPVLAMLIIGLIPTVLAQADFNIDVQYEYYCNITSGQLQINATWYEDSTQHTYNQTIQCNYGCLRTADGGYTCKEFQDDMPIPAEMYLFLEIVAFIFLSVGVIMNNTVISNRSERGETYSMLIFPILAAVLFGALGATSFNMLIGDAIYYSLGLAALNFSMFMVSFVYIWFLNFKVLGKAFAGED